MNLVLVELGLTGAFGNTSIKQLITVGTRDLNLYAIRPHLYKHLAPAGSLFMQVQDTQGRKIKNSETLAISAISVANYFHGYVRFLIDVSLKKNTQYYLSLESTGGYAYAGAAFVGWCNDYDLRKITPDFTTPSVIGVNAPLDHELWERKLIAKGDY